DRDATGKRDVTFPIEQAPAGDVDRDERGRTRRLHGEAGPAEIEPVRDPCRQEVGRTSECPVRPVQHAIEVAARPGAGEDADPFVAPRARAARMLERLPRALD